MYPHYDEKGKIFTPVITKKPVAVTIQTTTHLIHGSIHIRPEERIKDTLEKDEGFIAITGAEICDPQGQPLYRTGFLLINLSLIVWMTPDDELSSNTDQVQNE